jgi:hypothetical protein
MDMDKRRKHYSDSWNNADDVKRYAFLNHYRHSQEKGVELFLLQVEKSHLDQNQSDNNRMMTRQLIGSFLLFFGFIISLFFDISSNIIYVLISLFLSWTIWSSIGFLRAQIIKDRQAFLSNRIDALLGYQGFKRLYELRSVLLETMSSLEAIEEERSQLEYELSRDVWTFITNYKWSGALNYYDD